MTAELSRLISDHGYWIVGAIVALESMGVPLPGETALVTAAIYAGTTNQLNIAGVIVAASIGAILGDNAGFLVGRRFGYRLLLHYGSIVGLNQRRIKLGQFLFARHGAKIVFFGRFTALLRALAALLAGVNRMPWWRFLTFNAAGGIVWATLYGVGAYVLGREVERLSRPIAIAGVVLALAGGAAVFWFVRRHEADLEARAERALPGALPPESWR